MTRLEGKFTGTAGPDWEVFLLVTGTRSPDWKVSPIKYNRVYVELYVSSNQPTHYLPMWRYLTPAIYLTFIDDVVIWNNEEEILMKFIDAINYIDLHNTVKFTYIHTFLYYKIEICDFRAKHLCHRDKRNTRCGCVWEGQTQRTTQTAPPFVPASSRRGLQWQKYTNRCAKCSISITWWHQPVLWCVFYLNCICYIIFLSHVCFTCVVHMLVPE